MTYQKFVTGIGLGCLSIVKRHQPEKKSGELNASIKLTFNNDGFSISISAPHTVYTEEEWLSPRWNGKQNPNQGWIFSAFVDCYLYVQSKLTGSFDLEGEEYSFEAQVSDDVINYQNEQRELDSKYGSYGND